MKKASIVLLLCLIIIPFSVDAAIFTVTNTNDSEAGSLRQAIADANALEGDDFIEFDQSIFNSLQTITLTSGELQITGFYNLTINGTGANLLIISGNNASRVFSISGLSNNFNLRRITINNLTVTDGNTQNQGSGVSNGPHSRLTINNSIISGNAANGKGAGIANEGGNLTVNNSIISNNISNQTGGGIVNSDLTFVDAYGTTTINNATISNNKAFSGAGIADWSAFGSLTVNNSTINNNSATDGGGGILNSSGTEVNILNTTISGNSAKFGGGIFSYGSTIIKKGTIAFNSAGNNGGGVQTPNANVYALNTIFANNFSGDPATSSDFSGVLNSQGYNLIGNTTGTFVTGVITGNKLNIDPQLDPSLQNNGGSTKTHALKLNSPAIDAGSEVPGVATDQRGLPSPVNFPFIPNAVDGNGADIGAFEMQLATVASVTVSGRVIQAKRGITQARVYLTNQTGETRTALTNSFGYYRFEDVRAGETYTVNVHSKRYRFSPQIVSVNGEMSAVDFIAEY
ncbi:MAG TPA: carboxypeptidase-like regulatory domain-containing protein [Pyrinomonadaceae bacterium]|jgi:hypothetical protein